MKFFIHFFKAVAQPRLLKMTEGTRICQHGKHKATSAQGVPTSVYLMEMLSKKGQAIMVFSFTRDRKIAQDAYYQQVSRILHRKSCSRLFLGSEGGRHAVLLHSSACGCNNSELCERRAVRAQTGLSQPGWDEALQIFGAASGSAVGRMYCTRQSSGDAVRRRHSSLGSPVRPWLQTEKLGPAGFALKEMSFELQALSCLPTGTTQWRSRSLLLCTMTRSPAA